MRTVRWPSLETGIWPAEIHRQMVTRLTPSTAAACEMLRNERSASIRASHRNAGLERASNRRGAQAPLRPAGDSRGDANRADPNEQVQDLDDPMRIARENGVLVHAKYGGDQAPDEG